MRKNSKRSNKGGFSLIELLVAVIVIGILTALVVGKAAGLRERTYKVAMKNSLRRVAQAQEVFYARNNIYSGNASNLRNTTYGYAEDKDVTVQIIPGDRNKGYLAIALHNKSNLECGFILGEMVHGSDDETSIHCAPGDWTAWATYE